MEEASETDAVDIDEKGKFVRFKSDSYEKMESENFMQNVAIAAKLGASKEKLIEGGRAVVEHFPKYKDSLKERMSEKPWAKDILGDIFPSEENE